MAQLLFLIGWTRAEDCNITSRWEANHTIITRDCPTSVVVISCDMIVGGCTEETYTKTATSTTSVSTSSTQTRSTFTSTATTSTATTSTATVSSATFTLTMSSTTTRTTSSLAEGETAELNVTNETNGTDLPTDVPTSPATTSRLETTSDSVSVQSSTAADLVMIQGVISFAQDGVTQDVAEAAVAFVLSQFLGLPQGGISTSARALAKLRRRLSGVWSVNFDIETPADEEAKVKESLMQLKNSETFASKLKEELRFRGADPVADFKVSLDLEDDEEAGAGNDATQTIIIVAAVAAGLIMLGVVVWKVCSGGPRESNEPLKEKEESTRLDSTDGSGSVADNQYSHAPDTAVHPLEPTYLGVSAGYPRDVDDHGFYPASVVPEREFSEPPLPPPAESPPTRSLWSEVGETVAQEPANPIKLADVNPDISKRPPPLTEWTLVDHQLNQAACQALSPSSWTGSLIWTELPQVRHATPLPLNKEYKLNFQRAGRLAGHCNDASSQYKITGKHRESGELTWREVPQSSTGMAIECQGRLQIRELRGGAAKCECFEIVGVFTAVSTSISARHLGSGRFKLTTSVQPTAFGNSHAYDSL